MLLYMHQYMSIPAMIATKCDIFRLKKVISLNPPLKLLKKTPQSQAYVRPKGRSKDGSPTCSAQ